MTPATRTALTALLALLFVAVLVSLALPVAAQTPAPVPTIVATPLPPTPTPDPEVVALRAQLEVMERYDQRLLETVYWALGGMLTVVAVVVGAAWLFNWQYAQREKRTLLSELQSEVQASAKQAELALRSELEQEFAKVRQATKAMMDAASEKTEDMLEGLSADIEILKLRSSDLESEFWQQKGVPANTLRTRAESLSVVLGLQKYGDRTYFLSKILDQMQDLLERDISINADLAAFVNTQLDRLPPKYKMEAAGIRELLARARARS